MVTEATQLKPNALFHQSEIRKCSFSRVRDIADVFLPSNSMPNIGSGVLHIITKYDQIPYVLCFLDTNLVFSDAFILTVVSKNMCGKISSFKSSVASLSWKLICFVINQLPTRFQRTSTYQKLCFLLILSLICTQAIDHQEECSHALVESCSFRTDVETVEKQWSSSCLKNR